MAGGRLYVKVVSFQTFHIHRHKRIPAGIGQFLQFKEKGQARQMLIDGALFAFVGSLADVLQITNNIACSGFPPFQVVGGAIRLPPSNGFNILKSRMQEIKTYGD